jgi:hypothetical protein
MGQAAVFVSVLSAAVAAACCAAGRRPDPVILVTMALMVLSMLDTMALHSVLLGPFAWTAVLAGSALAVAVSRRRRPLGLERAAHLAVMALLTGAMAIGGGHGGAPVGESADGMAGMAHAPVAQAGAAGEILLLAVYVLACGLGGLQLARGVTYLGPACAERLSGAVSVIAMAAMVVLGQSGADHHRDGPDHGGGTARTEPTTPSGTAGGRRSPPTAPPSSTSNLVRPASALRGCSTHQGLPFRSPPAAVRQTCPGPWAGPDGSFPRKRR